MEKKRNTFGGSIGFILAAAGSAVGLGNIWRFPYLAAKDGGGMFLLIYLILAVTFGFTLLTAEIAIGRRTRQSPLTAYGAVKKNWKALGIVACLVPIIILPYYSAIGGWVIKYFIAFLTGHGEQAAADGYFGGFISSTYEPVVYMLIFLAITAVVVYLGVEKGIETTSKILMPALLIIIVGIVVFCLTLSHTDANGVTRTGIQGFKVLVVPDFENLTVKSFFSTLLDAMGQLFFSLSVAMGIMIAYGSYVDKKTNLNSCINKIEIFDTGVAFLAGAMIIPAVFAFLGPEGMEASGPSLMFVTLPKVFVQMGPLGNAIGALFFGMVLVAAITSSVSIMEAIVSSLMDRFKKSRRKSTSISLIVTVLFALLVCFGYSILAIDVKLPNGSSGSFLDIMDYISNNVLMPIVAIATCILIGWVVGPKYVSDEVEEGGVKFRRKKLFIVMIKFIAPVMLLILFLKSVGIITFI